MDAIIRMENVIKRNSAGKTILDIPAFQVEKESHICICGETGTGKTTMARILCGLDTVDFGEVFVDDYSYGNKPESVRTRIRNKYYLYLGSNPELWPELTVEEQFQASYCNRYPDITDKQVVQEQIEKALEDWELKRYAHYRNQHLSLLQKSQVLFALQMLREPEILLLDECFWGMNLVERANMEKMLQKANNQTILWFVDHMPNDNGFQHIYQIQDGCLKRI